jgi:small subunit ribosomal protein S16
MLKIKLTRTGSKNHPSYRVVVSPDRSKLTGDAIEILGYYLPLEKKLKINKDGYNSWVSKGAIPTDKVSRLFKSLK